MVPFLSFPSIYIIIPVIHLQTWDHQFAQNDNSYTFAKDYNIQQKYSFTPLYTQNILQVRDKALFVFLTGDNFVQSPSNRAFIHMHQDLHLNVDTSLSFPLEVIHHLSQSLPTGRNFGWGKNSEAPDISWSGRSTGHIGSQKWVGG